MPGCSSVLIMCHPLHYVSSLSTVAPIPGALAEFMLLVPHSSHSDVTLLLLFGRACLCLHAKSDRRRAGLGGHEWNSDEHTEQARVTWPLADRDHSSTSPSRGVYSAPVSHDDLPTAIRRPHPQPPAQRPSLFGLVANNPICIVLF